jgi:hypothetical protein
VGCRGFHSCFHATQSGLFTQYWSVLINPELTYIFLCLLWFVPAHTKFLSLSFHRKNCLLSFVLTHLFLCLLWFVPAETKFLSLSFHRKKSISCDLC